MLDEQSDYIISSFDYSDIPIINFFEGNKKNEDLERLPASKFKMIQKKKLKKFYL